MLGIPLLAAIAAVPLVVSAFQNLHQLRFFGLGYCSHRTKESVAR